MLGADTVYEFSRKLALRVFLKGLREPIGSLMRTKNPLDLNSALNMLTNDFQFHNETNKNKSSDPTQSNINRPIDTKPMTNNTTNRKPNYINQFRHPQDIPHTSTQSRTPMFQPNQQA